MNTTTRRVILAVTLVLIALAIILIEGQKVVRSNPTTSGATAVANNASGASFPAPAAAPANTDILKKELLYTRAPEFIGATGYLNTNATPITIAGLRGKIVLVDFMTYSCINCIRTFPALSAWYSTYKDQGLVVIGIHTPEFGFEQIYGNVLQAAAKYNLTFPIVLDNNMAIWTAYHNMYWPHQFLIDADGFIRYDHIGEGGDAQTEAMIRTLLDEAGKTPPAVTATIIPNAPAPDETNAMLMSPETYAGSERNPGIGSAKRDCSGTICTYDDATSHERDTIYLNGTWDQEGEFLQYAGPATGVRARTLSFAYQAHAINAVLDPGTGPFQAEVLLDGKPLTASTAGHDIIMIGNRSYVNVTMSRLYELTNHAFSAHELTLVATSPSFRINAFTFG